MNTQERQDRDLRFAFTLGLFAGGAWGAIITVIVHAISS